MNRAPLHRRNLLISTATMLVVLLLGYAHSVLAAPLISLPRTDLQQVPTVAFSPSAITVQRGGSPQTVSLLVTNTGSVTDSFTVRFTTVPDVLVTPDTTTVLDVAPNATAQVLVQIAASSTATPGDDTLGVNVSRQSTAQISNAQLQITISDDPTTTPASLQQQSTTVFSPNAITLLRGGSSQTVNLQVTNTGTTTDTFTVTFTNIPNVTVTPTTATISDVAPGGTGQVAVQIAANTTAALGAATLGANVSSQSDPTQTSSAQLAITIADAAPSLQISLREGERIREATPGNTVTYRLRIVNNGSAPITFDLAFDGTIRCSNDFSGCLQSFSGNTQNITLNANAGFDFDVDITLPNDTSIVGRTSNTRVIALVGGAEQAGLTLQINVVQATPTPTNTPTETPTQTPSVTPSPTETLGPICTDDFENDDSIGSAKLILVNLPQPQDPIRQENNDRRAICPSGDEDWLFFGAVAGKVYTIDVRDVAPGLDLSLEITDEDGNRITFNDDFFEREPVINPRIQSWRAPATAIYYIRVRDVTSNGGTDLTYRIEVQDESFGPTPQTVTEICQDQFEPDGLSEQANLITSNERQFDRRLCPTGDADWVTFFGKRNKRYFLYTDTRPYFNNNPVNPGINVQAGADTVITLVDRDGSTIIDVNDDIPGGQTLDSQLEFVPETDGFYFLQVKNVGDVGNQFIRYDLTMQLCIPGQEDCGRAFREDEPVVVTATAAIPTATLTEEFDLDATPTETPVP